MLANRELHVLLIEDTPGDARLIGTFLAHGNGGPFRLETVDCLSTAFDALASEPPDAILLDLGLPDSQGLDTLDRLRQQSGGTPIIVLTDLDDAATALPAIARGAQDCLPKGGFDEQLLVRTIRHAMERALAEETARASEELYRNLFEQANEAIVLIQSDVIRRINPRAVKILGYPGDRDTQGQALQRASRRGLLPTLPREGVHVLRGAQPLNGRQRSRGQMQRREHAALHVLGSFTRLYRHTAEDITRLVAVHDDQGTANFGSPSVGPLLGHALGMHLTPSEGTPA